MKKRGSDIPIYLCPAVELLGVSFRAHKEPQDYKIRDREHRISQFADDTTLFIKQSEMNLRLCIEILGEFYQISGLKINVDKTKVVNFGKIGTADNQITPLIITTVNDVPKTITRSRNDDLRCI